MSYNEREQDGFTVIELTGEIDLSRSPESREQILNLINAGHDVLVDMAGVTYIDSSGVASLIEGYQAARKQSRQFALVAVSESAMSVLNLARLDTVFPIHASVEDRLNQDG